MARDYATEGHRCLPAVVWADESRHPNAFNTRLEFSIDWAFSIDGTIYRPQSKLKQHSKDVKNCSATISKPRDSNRLLILWN